VETVSVTAPRNTITIYLRIDKHASVVRQQVTYLLHDDNMGLYSVDELGAPKKIRFHYRTFTRGGGRKLVFINVASKGFYDVKLDFRE
jgi:hypothetical protein